jgi:hypothetical protein
VLVWADASPAPARSADAVTIENSDFLMVVSSCRYNKFQNSGERQDRAQVSDQSQERVAADILTAPHATG